MKPPWVYRDARRQAPIHVQLLLTRRGTQPRDSESVRVQGRIVRVFRDDTHTLWAGKRVTFSVPVAGRDREVAPAPDGTIRHYWSSLMASRWFEAFLMRASDGTLELVESQIAPIRRPCLRPVCDPDDEGFLFRGNVVRL